MIHINKSKDKKYYVTVSYPNGKILSTSETFDRKESAWKNIAAMAKEFYTDDDGVYVTDSTFKIFGLYIFYWRLNQRNKILAK